MRAYDNEYGYLTARPAGRRWRPWLLGLLVLGGMLILAALVAGSLRYGGPEGLLLRVQAEFAASQPQGHPMTVPTPMPTPAGGVPQALILLDPSPSAAPVPTTTPSPAQPDEAAILDQEPAGQPASLPLDLPPDAPREPVSTLVPSPTPLTDQVGPELPSTVALSGLVHYWQTWNNCGPATLAMNLSFYGSTLSQADTAAVLKPDKNDKNVSPQEMADFARSQGYQARVLINGNSERLKRLVAAGVPVLVETWLEDEPDNGMGHYRLITGYDDARQQWIAYDSYVSKGVDPDKPYPGIRMSYGDLTELWRVFNRTHVVIFPASMEPAVSAILGEDLDETVMWQRSLAQAQAEAQKNPQDAFAWFNLGSSYVALGDYGQAAAAFDQARVIGLPWRMLWYQFGPFHAYHETGRFRELVALADATIATAGNIEETFYWKGRALQALGDLDGARQSYQRAVELNVNYAEAAAALAGLTPG